MIPALGGEDKLDENASPPATYLRRKIPIIHPEGGIILQMTLPKTNIFAPENGWLEDYFPFGRAYFQLLR